MTSIFLSYARGDDGERFDPASSFVARLHRDLTARGFNVWFDGVSMPSRNLTFHQEIRDAVTACDRLVLVVGPKATNSDYVRQEWQFAYFEADKVVTPILRKGDFPLVPDELKLLHCEDFREDAQYAFHLEQLTRILREPPPPLGKLIGVPGLPAHYLSRADRLVPLRDAVRTGLDSPAPFGGVAARHQFHGIAGLSKQVGMHGMGGIGKSVLANLLSRDRKIREAFPDGIIWVGLGSVPVLVELLRRVHQDLGGDGAFTTEHEGKVKVKELLADKAVLLVLDDAWRKSDVDAFDVLGPRCRALITTRDAGLLTSLGGTHHLVELLTDEEALRLLAVAVGCELDQLPAEASQVVKQCGRLPLAVSLAGGIVVAGIPWASLLNAFERHKLEFFEDEHRPEQHQNLWKMIEISVKALTAETQTRLVELGVFPEDESVPEAAVATLWRHTGELDDLDTQQLLIKLKQRSLVQFTAAEPGSSSMGRVALHDLIHDYCIRRATQEFGNETALHDCLLGAYRWTCPDGWWTGPNDGYFFEHLREHLIAADRAGELANVLHELRWLEVKNEAGLTFDLIHDFRAALDALSEQDRRRRILRLLNEALRREIHFIHRHRKDYPQGLFQCLWNYGWWYDCPDAAKHYETADGPWNGNGEKLYVLLERWRKLVEVSAPGVYWLLSLRPPTIHLDSPLLAVLRGHEGPVSSVAVSPDGRWILSGAQDRTVRVWDAESGAGVHIFRGHEGPVWSVAYSPNGRTIVSGGAKDNTVRLWDAENGAELRLLRGHDGWVTSVAFSPDGRRIASGSRDKSVRIWNADIGEQLQVLRGHDGTVTSVAFSSNEWSIASAAYDETVRVWNVDCGDELFVLRGHDGEVQCVSISPDGRRIASGAWDATVRLWDVETGQQLRILCAHESGVNTVAFSPDGQQIAAGADKTIRVWNADSGEELYVLRGHQEWVESVAFSPDGQRIVSGARDKTVRVWYGKSAEIYKLRGHEEDVTKIAFSPDGHWVVSAGYDDSLRIWETETGAELRVLHGHERVVTTVAFSADGRRIASGSEDKTVRLWDAVSGKELYVLRGHEGWVSSVAFSADGRRIASGSEDKTVRLWDIERGVELPMLRGHEDLVWSVSFSADGRWIASGAWDKTVRVWDVESGKEIRVLRGHESGVTNVAFFSDGRRIASATYDNTIRVWDADSGECLATRPGFQDLVAIVEALPFHIKNQELETVIEDAETNQPIAWFPISFVCWRTKMHPGGRTWVGASANHVHLLRLEGASA